MPLTTHELTKTDKSILLYAESCCVDYGGLLEGRCMNADDIQSLEKYKAAGVLDFGRIPARLLNALPTERKVTQWVTLTDAGWQLAAQLRRERARVTPSRQLVDESMAEKCGA